MSTPITLEPLKFVNTDLVLKTSGDYKFLGHVRAAFHKGNGVARYVVENNEGILHIFNGAQLEKVHTK